VADHDHPLPAVGNGLLDVVRSRSGGKPFVGLGIRARGERERGARLPGTQERARHDDVRLHSIGLEPFAEPLCLLAALIAQRTPFVGVARGRIRVPHKVELHAGGRIDRGVGLSFRIRDLIVASWTIERDEAERLLPPGLEPAPVDGDYLISLAAMRYQSSGVVPPFSQINVRTYVADEREEAVYFLLSRVTLPGLVGVLLGAPVGLAQISVGPGFVEAPGLGVSLRYRVGEVTDSGPVGRHELGIFGRARLRAIRIRRSATVWHRGQVDGPVRADPILHYGIEVNEPATLLYTDGAVLELDGRARRMLPSSRRGGKMGTGSTV
jgi:hypothetical protein